MLEIYAGLKWDITQKPTHAAPVVELLVPGNSMIEFPKKFW
jgi:hypothetical protein